MSLADAFHWFAGLAPRHKLLSFAISVVLVELSLRRFAPKSRAYTRWSRFFVGLGSVWTAVILSLVYVLSVGPIGIATRLFGKDPLDRTIGSRPSFWHAHDPNPLGPERAARHQF